VNENLSTAEILKHINYTITKNIQKIKLNTYITLTLLARENNKFYYSGKHLDIPIFRKKSQTLEIIPTFGSWLGMEDYFNEFDVREFEFEKGDIAFLYTDGLIEAIEIENPRKGLEKAYQIFLESCRKNFSTEDILRALQKEFKGIEPSDDITYLILKKI
jgi:serine phosphatase RsbU (regulator of sigma subunit)